MKKPLILLILSAFGLTATTQSQTNIKNNLTELGLTEEKIKDLDSTENKVTNIAFFGVDRRSTSDFGNSDIVMIISINNETNKVKLSSIMRDTYVKIYARGKNKINAAYFEGGPKLAIRTLNENFDLAITEYISVDFFGSAKIIQALGGVEIDVKEEEMDFLNNYLGEIAGIDQVPAQFITKPGLQHLNGKQAIAYSRIRGVGRGDYDRIKRQKAIIDGVATSFSKKGKDLLPIVIKDILPNIETNLDYTKLFKLGTDMMAAKSKSFDHARFPLDNVSKGIRVNNIWYLSANMELTTKALHNFIYKDINPLN